MAVVVFDPTAFATAYPEFSGFSTPVLDQAFAVAELYCNNTDGSVVQDLTTRTTLLWLMTAHILKLFYGTNGVVNGGTVVTAPSDLVGRLETAKEGTILARADMGPASASAAWYNQTRYGAAFWALILRFRTARYIPYAPPLTNPPGPTPAIWPLGRWS